MQKAVIFDFDGTLADTLDLAIQFGNENQGRFSTRGISKDDFRNFSMREALKHIELPLYKLPRFALELKEYIRTHLLQVKLFPGITDLIPKLKSSGRNIYIMSSNSEENISAVLKRYELLENFSGIYSDSSIFGKHRVLKRMLSQCDIDHESTLYVGDEVRDFEACKRMGVEMVAVSWGWDNDSRLRQSGIERIASDISGLEKLLI